MANDITRTQILANLFTEVGIVASISVSDINATPVGFTVTYDAAMTAQQIALGDQIKAAFDWRKRRALARATVVAANNQLTAGQRALINAHMQAEYLRTNPKFSAVLAAALEIPLTVDEVDPT
jgi:hypothetical protein